MDAFATGAAAGLLANALTLTLEKFYDEWRDESKARVPRLRQSWIRSVIDQEPLLADPARFLSNNRQEDADALMAYLISPEVASLVTDLVAANLAGASRTELELRARKCYQQLLFFGASKEAASEVAETLTPVFNGIAQRIVEALQRAASTTPNDTQQRLAAARHRVADRHAEVIEGQLSLITTLVDRERVDIKQLMSRQGKLASAVARVHATITPPNLHTARRVPVESLFVTVAAQVTIRSQDVELVPDAQGELVNAVRQREETGRYDLPWSLPRLWERSRRCVILGTPGAGKTTVTDYIAKLIGENALAVQPEVAVPIIVREHASATGSGHGIDFVGALQRTCLDRYQVRFSRPEVEYLVATARLALIVDGLDELLVTQDRLRVTQSLEAFCSVYPECFVLATSRVVGYDEAPLPSSLFSSGEIQPLSAQQVQTYADNWFKTDVELSPAQREALVEGFMEDSKAVPDLRQNALLLSLMCTLYRHERQLPRNRPKIYEACANLLFDTWDRRRQLRPSFDFDAHVNGAVQHLARFIFEDQEKQRGVAEPELVQVAAAYFREWQYASDAEAFRAAQDFINFCKGRAWVLTDTGSSGSNVALLGFTHRTFLEYFTAVDISRSLTVSQLLDFFEQRPQNAAWNVVCQILLQLAPTKQRGLENDLIARLHTVARRLPQSEADIALNVALQSLAAVPFKPDSVRTTVRRALDRYLRQTLHRPDISGDSGATERIREKFWLSGSSIAVENHRAAAEVINTLIGDLVDADPTIEFAISHLVDFHLVEGVDMANLPGVLRQDRAARVEHLAVSSPQSWLVVSAILFGAFAELSEREVRVAQFRGDLRAGGVTVGGPRNPFGGNDLPTPAEIVIWRAAHCDPDGSSDVASLARQIGAPALAAIAKSETIVGYRPHWTWYSIGPAVRGFGGLVDPPVAELPFDILLPLAFALTELHLWDAEKDDLRRRAQNLAMRDWGALSLVPACISLRYKVDGPEMSSDAVRFLRELALWDWCKGRTRMCSSRPRRRS